MTALEGAKRKAGSPPEGADARSKRQPADQPAAGPLEERRLELAEVYAAYTALASAPPGAPPPEQPYLRLLKAGQGEWGSRGAWAGGVRCLRCRRGMPQVGAAARMRMPLVHNFKLHP